MVCWQLAISMTLPESPVVHCHSATTIKHLHFAQSSVSRPSGPTHTQLSLMLFYHAFTNWQCQWKPYVFWLSIHCVCPSVCLSVYLSGQILLPRYLMNGLNSLNETDREYLVAPTDDLIRLWRSKVKVKAGHRGGEWIHIYGSQSPSSSSSWKINWLMSICSASTFAGVRLTV